MFASSRNPLGGLPRRAVIVEVSARDGLQSVPDLLPAATRAAWIRSLLETGVPEAEAGSFVDPRRLPQMADAPSVLAHLADQLDRLWVLVPNLHGLDAAHAAGARKVVCLVSATETHSVANLGRPVARVLSDLETLADRIRSLGIQSRVAISMAWGESREGVVPPDRIVGICRELDGMGFTDVTLCDTDGGASPRHVADLLEALEPHFPHSRLGLHFHDRFGVAAANVLVGLLFGVTRFDASIGGLGGCPFAPGAKGNLPTEDLVYLLEGMGVETGVALAALRQTSKECLSLLGRESANRLRD